MNIRKGLIKRIHVDRQILARNKKTGTNESAITIQTSKGPIKASHVVIDGGCQFVQAGFGRRPLSCGARVWIETTSRVSYTP